MTDPQYCGSGADGAVAARNLNIGPAYYRATESPERVISVLPWHCTLPLRCLL
jgi:hypothetical protein